MTQGEFLICALFLVSIGLIIVVRCVCEFINSKVKENKYLEELKRYKEANKKELFKIKEFYIVKLKNNYYIRFCSKYGSVNVSCDIEEACKFEEIEKAQEVAECYNGNVIKGYKKYEIEVI